MEGRFHRKWDNILEIFYPSHCLGCGTTLQYSYQELFCPLCHQYVKISDTHLNPSHPLKARLRKRFPFELVLSKYRYPNDSQVMRGMIRGLKYQHLKYIGSQEGKEYGEVIRPILLESEVSFLVPVPLFRRKRIKRGYNQSLEWAKGISESTGIKIADHLVRRVKNTRSQTLLNKEERIKNMSGAFRVKKNHPGIAAGESFHFLLLDDVVTSGTTLVELAGKMKEAFPGSKYSVCTLMYKDY